MTEEPRRDRGALEHEVLLALGAAHSPLSPSEVLADLNAGLAYTTVMTTLARLHRKGALTRKRRGRAYAYALAGSIDTVAATLTAGRMRRLLDAGDADRGSVLARFVADLDPADERLLISLLATDDPATDDLPASPGS